MTIERNAVETHGLREPASIPLVVQEAFDQLPSIFNPCRSVELLKFAAHGNILCKFESLQRTYVLKIFRATERQSPLLPLAADCAIKEAWIAKLPELRDYIPSIHHIGRLAYGSETLSFLVQDFATGISAANICTESDATAFAGELGRLCRRLHGVTANGFGAVISPTEESFSSYSWNEYVEQRLSLCNIHELADTSPSLTNVVDEVRSRILLAVDESVPTLFHHDLLHNWSNVLLHPGTTRPANVIDWDQCGSGNALVVDLGVARFALRDRGDAAFGWKAFLSHFLDGYGIEIDEYRSSLIRSVNAFSTLYAARSAHLFLDRRSECETYVLEALGNDIY